MMDAIFGRALKGATKSVVVEADAFTISYRALYHGFKGDKRIPFSSITAIQFKEPGNWIAGYIQFSIKGGVEWQGPVNQDENAIQFDSKDAADFRALRDYAQSRMALGEGSPSTVSVADELAKLANLRDQGVLSEEEFAAQKVKLLT